MCLCKHPKYIILFTHFVQLNETTTKVSNVHLDIKPIIWIEKNLSNCFFIRAKMHHQYMTHPQTP
jgi:hypothetical protein